jgi:hypothetical protein
MSEFIPVFLIRARVQNIENKHLQMERTGFAIYMFHNCIPYVTKQFPSVSLKIYMLRTTYVDLQTGLLWFEYFICDNISDNLSVINCIFKLAICNIPYTVIRKLPCKHRPTKLYTM